MTTVKNVMSVVKSSTLFVVGIIVVFVARYSATGVVIWRFQGLSWVTMVKRSLLSLDLMFI